MVDIGSKAKRIIDDYKLSRYACYLIVQNGDSKGSVELCGCQVGEYEKTYYKYNSRKKGSVGAQVDNDNEVYRTYSSAGYCD